MPLEIFTLAEGFDGVFARKTAILVTTPFVSLRPIVQIKGAKKPKTAQEKTPMRESFLVHHSRACVRKHVTLFQVNQSPLYLVRGAAGGVSAGLIASNRES